MVTDSGGSIELCRSSFKPDQLNTRKRDFWKMAEFLRKDCASRCVILNICIWWATDIYYRRATVDILTKDMVVLSPFQDKLDCHLYTLVTPHEQYGGLCFLLVVGGFFLLFRFFLFFYFFIFYIWINGICWVMGIWKYCHSLHQQSGQ